jgi:hypothetical protein
LGSLDWGEDGGLGRGPLALGFLAGALGVAFLAFQQDAFEFGLAIAAALLFGLELSPELTCHAGHVNSADAKGVTGSVAQLKKSRKALHWLESVPRGVRRCERKEPGQCQAKGFHGACFWAARRRPPP